MDEQTLEDKGNKIELERYYPINEYLSKLIGISIAMVVIYILNNFLLAGRSDDYATYIAMGMTWFIIISGIIAYIVLLTQIVTYFNLFDVHNKYYKITKFSIVSEQEIQQEIGELYLENSDGEIAEIGEDVAQDKGIRDNQFYVDFELSDPIPIRYGERYQLICEDVELPLRIEKQKRGFDWNIGTRGEIMINLTTSLLLNPDRTVSKIKLLEHEKDNLEKKILAIEPNIFTRLIQFIFFLLFLLPVFAVTAWIIYYGIQFSWVEIPLIVLLYVMMFSLVAYGYHEAYYSENKTLEEYNKIVEELDQLTSRVNPTKV